MKFIYCKCTNLTLFTTSPPPRAGNFQSRSLACTTSSTTISTVFINYCNNRMSGLGCFFLATPFHTMLTNSVPNPRVTTRFCATVRRIYVTNMLAKFINSKKPPGSACGGKNTRAKDKHLSTNLPLPVSKRRWGKGKEKPEENQKIYISILVRFAAAARVGLLSVRRSTRSKNHNGTKTTVQYLSPSVPTLSEPRTPNDTFLCHRRTVANAPGGNGMWR